MRFPQTNKIHQEQPIDERFGENAKALEEILSKINWRFLLKVYFAGLGVFLLTLFLIIVIVRLALIIF